MCHVLNRDKVDIFRTQPQRHKPKLLGVPHEQPLSTHHQPAHDLRQRGEAACWVSCMCSQPGNGLRLSDHNHSKLFTILLTGRTPPNQTTCLKN